MSYTSVFGGATIYPSELSYYSVALNTTDVVLSWPLDTNSSENIAASIVEVNCTVGGLSIFMPPADLASTGQTTLFNNVGTQTFTVKDTGGNTIMTVASGELWQVYLADNTTANGTWRQYQYGVGVSSATAGALAGLGIRAIATTLNQAQEVVSFNTNYTAGTGNRSQLLVWTNGVGTLTLPLPADVGNDWFMSVRNQGTGTLTIDPSGGYTIDGAATKDVSPTNSCFIVCDGTQYFTIGYGQNVNFAFNYTSISLNPPGSGTYTLSTAEQNKISYKFTGALSGNIAVIVPPTVQQYWVDNSTTNAYTMTVRTSTGTGYAVPQGTRAILYCDGTDVVNAATAGIATPISIADGGTGATTAGGALINLGGGSAGIAVFQSSTQAQGRTALGGSTIGQALFTSPASIATMNTLVGGSGYVNGSYTNVPLTGGSGIGALADITVSGTSVTAVTLVDGGLGYEVGDLLSASNTNLGGSGAGFNISVATITAVAARATLEVYSIDQVDALIEQTNQNALAYAVSLG
jgi:hypothetical protein